MRIHRSLFVLILMVVCLTAQAKDRAVQAAADENRKPLPEFLAGTRWFWLGSNEHILELRKDGTAHLDYWQLPTHWKVTGPSEVTFTMHFKTEDKTAVVTFTEDRSAFTGIQFNKTSVIARSPRASGNLETAAK